MTIVKHKRTKINKNIQINEKGKEREKNILMI